MKTQILAAIGETVLQPATRLNEALAANDRIKYFFSLLQLALAYAEHPNQPAGTLKRERIACGIDDPDLDTVVAEARASGKSCHVPGAARILVHIAADTRVMAEPVLAGHENGLEPRLDGLLKALPTASGDLLDPEAISAMMQAGHDHPDSLHRLVMDLHKRLNAMQAELAEETLDGAAVYGLSESDRPLVAAFMAGVNRTAKLAFTRNPAIGTNELYFDFQFNSQGEDVVSGRQHLGDKDRLRLVLPAVWTRLNEIRHDLETLFREAEDFEFTVQAGVLFLLQTRRAKRTDWAALAIAVDMVEEGLLTPAEALAHLDGIDLAGVVRTSFAPPVPRTLAVAEVASMGVVSGVVALDSAAVKCLSLAGTPVIFVRRETVTTDIEGMALAAGILTASGGRTSHAAVVARQLGKVCLVACPGLEINLDTRQCTIGGTVLNEGDFLSLDGNTGAVHLGSLTPVVERPERALAAVATWSHSVAAAGTPAAEPQVATR